MQGVCKMTAILTLTRNNLSLTQKCIWTALRQDVKAVVWAIDNGSTDGTVDWLAPMGLLLDASPFNSGVSAGWNRGLEACFQAGHESVLVIGNDTQLAPWTYRLLDSYNLPFVTGVAVDDYKQIEQPMPPKMHLEDHPDFSCFLIRRECWGKVGKFDESMKLYASDCDYHLRAHRSGVPMKKAVCPFYHERSSTLRLATEREREEIQGQANRDRAVFYQRYGCLPGQKEYYELFQAVGGLYGEQS